MRLKMPKRSRGDLPTRNSRDSTWLRAGPDSSECFDAIPRIEKRLRYSGVRGSSLTSIHERSATYWPLVSRRWPFLLPALLLVGVGLGIGLGLSEAPASEPYIGSAMPPGHPAAVSTSSTTTTTSLTAGTPVPGSPGWPLAVFEPAVSSTGGALSQCPNPVGLEAFSAQPESRARADATDYGNISLNTDLHNSDPSWWPDVEQMWAHGKGHGLTNPYIVSSESGLSGPSTLLVPHSCGSTIGGETFSVIVGPSPNPDCEACRTTFSFIDRGGQALIYFIY